MEFILDIPFIDYMLDRIMDILTFLDYNITLFTIAVPANKNPLIKLFNE
tara:strand:- start:1196 stop:1342 length:147 start_codon:yes stop_codon:yes gene_type:complete